MEKRNDSHEFVTVHNLMKVAELQIEIKKLEDNLDEERMSLISKTNECVRLSESLVEKEVLVERMQQRQKELEKSMREQEMQIKGLNELR